MSGQMSSAHFALPLRATASRDLTCLSSSAQFSGSAPRAILPSRPARSEGCRAQRQSRMARSATVRLVLDGREHDCTRKRLEAAEGSVHPAGLAARPMARAMVASTYIRLLRSGLPSCCLHGRSRRWDGAQLMNGRWLQPICEMEEQPRIRPARHTQLGCRNSAHLWY